jgi:hypothetical protein
MPRGDRAGCITPEGCYNHLPLQTGGKQTALPFVNHHRCILPTSAAAPTRGDILHAIGARVGAAGPEGTEDLSVGE